MIFSYFFLVFMPDSTARQSERLPGPGPVYLQPIPLFPPPGFVYLLPVPQRPQRPQRPQLQNRLQPRRLF